MIPTRYTTRQHTICAVSRVSVPFNAPFALATLARPVSVPCARPQLEYFLNKSFSPNPTTLVDALTRLY